MKPALLLRAASVLTLLLGAGHTMGMPWTPDRSARGLALVAEMKDFHIDAMGFSRSYYDFYVGFGLFSSVSLFALALLLWLIGGMAKTEAAATRPLIAVLFAGFAAYTVLDCLYFFTAPLVLTVPAAACLGLALISAKSAHR